MSKGFRGTGVALVTPFDDQGKIDYKGLENLIEHLIGNGIDYLVIQGTTGESVTLTKEEKRAEIDFVVDVTKQRVPVVLGHGGNNTAALLEGFSAFDFSGIDAILSVSPAYNKPTQTGIIRHFEAIAAASPVPIILYNVPGRTSSNMTAETTLHLANTLDKVIAIKEASGNLAQIGTIIRNRPEGFLVISGDDALIVPHLSLGGDGIISVIGNAFPGQFSSLVNAGLEGDFATARDLFYRVTDTIDLLFAEGNPGGVKAALKILGICGDTVRLPLANISDALFQRMEAEVNKVMAVH